MCKGLDDELKKGESLALKLVKHVENMRASQCEIPIESKGISYLVKIIQVKEEA